MKPFEASQKSVIIKIKVAMHVTGRVKVHHAIENSF